MCSALILGFCCILVGKTGCRLRSLDTPASYRTSTSTSASDGPLNDTIDARYRIYVSMTVVYERQNTAYLTLLSLLNQKYPPDGIFVHVSSDPYLRDPGFPKMKITNAKLASLVRNPAISLRWVNNTGPYRKLIPLLAEKWNEQCLIITVDDDSEYKQGFIQLLVDSYKKYSCPVTARAWVMRGVSSMKDVLGWRYNKKRRAPLYLPQKFVIATHGGGTLYHPSVFHGSPWVLDEPLFTTLAPTADDIWYNVARISNNQTCVTVEDQRAKKFKNDNSALYVNYNKKGNDEQIRKVVEFALGKYRD